MKKTCFLLVVFMALLSLSGCATVSNTSEGLGKGVSEDLKNTCNNVKRFDAWLRDKAW
ncbi:MAG: hypothetical protein PHV55_04940 [Candidatus Omnitrophica bacterium]|nr:hypothetical protein [Candidatus Omnitrophota bacterium]